jgi:DNA uptake protein ComE-like DNA-binding protein
VKTITSVLIFVLAFILISSAAIADDRKTTAKPAASKKAATKTAKPGPSVLVDINTASREKLMGLGISEEEANKIIAARPYKTKTILLTNGILQPESYNKIKSKIAAYPPKQTR